MTNAKVVALVVTYNRSEKVKTTIEHVLRQTYPIEQVIIIDNASTDDTPTVLGELADANPTLDVRRQTTNLGGAGGFSVGLRWAYETGADLFWAMDDDCYAKPNALARLVEEWQTFADRTGHKPGFMCSLVHWGEGEVCEMNIPKPTWDWPRFFDHLVGRNLVLVQHCSFVSVLIPRARVKAVGLPIAEFFIWFDDVEYTKRLAREYPGVLVLDSIVQHDLTENKGVNFGLVDESNVWKFSYGARNEAYYHKTKGGFLAWFDYASRTMGTMRKAKVAPPLRRKIAKALYNGLRMKVEIERVD